jgi:uncharacterized protein (TIGR04255 family)
MKSDTKSPLEIHLPKSPLVEAWLDIRWQLIPTGVPNMLTDPLYPFALGIFYNSIKDKFGYKEELPASKAPEGFFPFVLQHRFRSEKDGWPLIQFGPGIATLNYTKPYSWTDFKTKALYLRENLLLAYQGDKLEAKSLILHYRNVYPYKYSSNLLTDFLKDNLNTNISIPSDIPGHFSAKPTPADANITFRYELNKPQGIGQIQIVTGYSRESENPDNVVNNEVVIWEFNINSTETHVPDIKSENNFVSWLEDAHEVIHYWFFALIEGKLFNEFNKG